MAGAARARPELRELLGDDRTAAVERLLLARAVEWGEALSDGPVTVARDDEGLADAVPRVFDEAGHGAVIVVWPVLPRWRAAHADAVTGRSGRRL